MRQTDTWPVSDMTTLARSYTPATKDAVGVCSESVYLVIGVALAMKGRKNRTEREEEEKSNKAVSLKPLRRCFGGKRARLDGEGCP